MVELDTSEINQLTNLFDNIPTDFDMTSVKDDLTNIVRSDLDMRFLLSPTTDEGGYANPAIAGVYWEPLTDYSFKLKPERKGGQLLIDTGRLRDSVTLPNGPYQWTEILGDKFIYRTDIEYAETVQEKRPFMFMYRELVDQLSEAIINKIYPQS